MVAVASCTSKAAKESAADRAAIAVTIKTNSEIAAREVQDATATMQRSLLALKTETETKIKKTNKRITAYADAITKEAKDVEGLMKAQMTKLTTKINQQKEEASKAIKSADAASAAAFAAVSDKVESVLEASAKKSNP